jgi:hypothetical protein
LSTLVDLIRVLGPTLITVLLGALIIQRYFVSRSNQAALIDLLIRELDGLRDDSLSYWSLHNATKDDVNKQEVFAARLKGTIRSLSGDLDYYCDRYCKKRKSEFTRILGEICDACTGGSFESQSHPKDCGRYLTVVNTINRLRSELFKQKI